MDRTCARMLGALSARFGEIACRRTAIGPVHWCKTPMPCTPELPEGVRSVSKRVCNENGPNLEKSAMCAQRKQIMNYVIKLKNTVAHQNKRNRSEEIRYALSVSTAHYRSQRAVCSGWWCERGKDQSHILLGAASIGAAERRPTLERQPLGAASKLGAASISAVEQCPLVRKQRRPFWSSVHWSDVH